MSVISACSPWLAVDSWLRRVFPEDASALASILHQSLDDTREPTYAAYSSASDSTTYALREISVQLVYLIAPYKHTLTRGPDDVLFSEAADAVRQYREQALVILSCKIWEDIGRDLKKDLARECRTRLWNGMLGVIPDLLLQMVQSSRDGGTMFYELADYGLIAPEDLIDWHALGGVNTEGYPYGALAKQHRETRYKPNAPHRPNLDRGVLEVRYWVEHLHDDFFTRLLPAFRAQPDSCIGRVAMSLQQCFPLPKVWGQVEIGCACPFWKELQDRLESMLQAQPCVEGWWEKHEGLAVWRTERSTKRHLRFASRERLWRAVRFREQHELDELDRQLSDEQCLLVMSLAEVKRAILRYAFLVHGDTPGALPAGASERLCKDANRELVQVRFLYKEVGATLNDAAQVDLVGGRLALPVLACFGGLWRLIKPVILILREVQVPAFERDLDVRGRKDPSTELCSVCALAANLAQVLHDRFGPEQQKDPELTELRTSFARFCIERLKSVRAESTRHAAAVAAGLSAPPVEPNPVWRAGYLRAAAELHAPHLKGRYFDVLRRACSQDPDESVRTEAKKLYDMLRSRGYGETRFSPRRMVFAALWQIRRAQCVALAGESYIDVAKAQSVKDREARETTSFDLEKYKETSANQAEA